MPHEHKVLTFNLLKHHKQFVNHFIINKKLTSTTQIHALLLPIGASQMDVYTGDLSVENILAEIHSFLIANHHLTDKHSYARWIDHQGGFGTVVLSDGSRWILRVIDSDAYVHIHPGRYSPHTVRVKANAWKTAIATLLVARHRGQSIDLRLVNEVRAEGLGLSPVRALDEDGELGRLLRLLANAL